MIVLLAPQFGTSQFDIAAISEHCVRLSWEPPQYPGSLTVEYQVKQDNYRWGALYWLQISSSIVKIFHAIGSTFITLDNICLPTY